MTATIVPRRAFHDLVNLAVVARAAQGDGCSLAASFGSFGIERAPALNPGLIARCGLRFCELLRIGASLSIEGEYEKEPNAQEITAAAHLALSILLFGWGHVRFFCSVEAFFYLDYLVVSQRFVV